MKINIEKAFEKFWMDTDTKYPTVSFSMADKNLIEATFQAAYSQLMPIIEKQNEAFYNIRDNLNYPFEMEDEAGATVAWVEVELKSLTDTSLHSEKLAGDGGEG